MVAYSKSPNGCFLEEVRGEEISFDSLVC